VEKNQKEQCLQRFKPKDADRFLDGFTLAVEGDELHEKLDSKCKGIDPVTAICTVLQGPLGIQHYCKCNEGD